MQEQRTIGPMSLVTWDMLPGQSLAALLALVGTKRMDIEALRSRTRLAPLAFASLLKWLQQEYLVDIVSSLNGDHIGEKVELTDRGEAVLVSMLERTSELPEPF